MLLFKAVFIHCSNDEDSRTYYLWHECSKIADTERRVKHVWNVWLTNIGCEMHLSSVLFSIHKYVYGPIVI